MIDKLTLINTDNTYPYKNLAVEEYLTTHAAEGECILYLWQNRHTVVIGKNQNCWKECKVNFLEEDGGYLVRRLSGGGAVFHDMGNLNFTFMVRHQDYDVDRQLSVILRAVNLLGIQAEKTGRNDITAEGRKFSGNAFYRAGDCCYHHGTLLIDVNTADMSKYLNVDMRKLQSKGVDSVKSRVANLKEFRPDITVEMLRGALAQAFSEVYGLPYQTLTVDQLPEDEIAALTAKFESWEWKYGKRIPFTFEIDRRFEWGDLTIQLSVNEGMIKEVSVFSDSMDQDIADVLTSALTGIKMDAAAAAEAVRNALPAGSERDDIVNFIKENI